jgi:hypothetical protein
MAPVSKQPDSGIGSCAQSCIATGESTIEALQRVEAECGWSDAPRLIQALDAAVDKGQVAGGAGLQP